MKMSTYKQCFSNDTVFCQIYLKTNNDCRSCARRAKLTLLLIVVVTSDSANLQIRSVDDLIFRKSR